MKTIAWTKIKAPIPGQEPFVSLVIPCRNEGRHIEGCLQSIIGQDYPSGKMEVLVVDGMSGDDTRSHVATLAARDARIRLVDNTKRIVSTALNLGVAEARGEVIMRVDARCKILPDYVRRCIESLSQTGAQNAGGMQLAVGEGYWGRAIALGTSHPFGIGNSPFHYAVGERFVDTVYLGAYPREVFARVGPFDEDMVRNQDNVFNYRLRQAGGKIFFNPAIKAYYYGRTSLSGLWRQRFEYAYWNVRAIQKYPRAAVRLRHLVPPLFLLGLLATGVGAFFSLVSAYLFLGVSGAYMLGAMTSSLGIAWKRGWRYLPALPVVFGCLHFSYGFGYFGGFLALVRGSFRKPARETV